MAEEEYTTLMHEVHALARNGERRQPPRGEAPNVREVFGTA
jgi:hypothetical protein